MCLVVPAKNSSMINAYSLLSTTSTDGLYFYRLAIIVNLMGGHSLDKYNGLEWGLSTFRNGPHSLVSPSTTWCRM